MTNLEILLDSILESISPIISESFDSGVDYIKDDWGTESEEGNFVPNYNEIAHFTVGGVDYMWVAKENYYDDNVFEIVFGVDKKERGVKGEMLIDIDVTGSGNAGSVLSTVIEITNDFVETFENVTTLTFTSKDEEKSRTKLYSRMVDGGFIEGFELRDKSLVHGDWVFTLDRMR